MKKVLAVLFITFTITPNLVHAGFLDRSLSLFNSFFEEEKEKGPSNINYCYRNDLDASLEGNAQCAEQICASSPTPSAYLSPEGINQRLASQKGIIKEQFSGAQEQLQETLRGLEATQRALHTHARRRKTGMLASIDAMSTEDLSRLTNNMLSPYISNYRWESNADGPFTYIPDDLSPEHHQALRGYSQKAWNNRNEFPTVIRPNDSLEIQRDKARNAINAIKQNVRSFMSDRSGDLKDLNKALDFKLQLVSRASGEELERIIINTDTDMKRAFYLEGDLNLVDYDKMNSCSDTACKNMLKAMVNVTLDQRIAEATEPSADELVATAMLNCRSRHAAHIMEDLDNQTAKEKYDEVLRDFLNTGLADFSEHSKNVFRDYANSQMVVAQDITANSGGDFINYLNGRQAPPRRLAKENGVYNLFRDSGHLLLVLTGSIRSKRGERFNLNTVCPDPVDAVGLNDYTSASEIGGQGLFQVGQGINSHFLHGKQAIARELTYVLVDSTRQGNWSSESLEMFRTLRGCAVQNYAPGHGNSNQGRGPYFENDLYTTNGDFADLMAYRTYPNEPQLFGCGLFQSVSNESNPDNYRLINNGPEQTNSTPFMRLIQESIHKNIELPQTCQRVIEENSHRIGTRSCL